MARLKKKSVKRTSDQDIRSLGNAVAGFVQANARIFRVTVVIAAVLVLGTGGYWLKRSSDESASGGLLATAYELYGPRRDYAKAVERFRDIQKQYPSSNNGAIAQFYAGNSLVHAGRYEEALKEYEAFARQYPGDKFLLGLVYQRMGYVHSELGRVSEAVQSFEKAEALTGPGAATVELARLYEASGNLEASQRKYKLIADKLAGTTWAMNAMSKVQKTEPGPSAAKAKESK